VLCEDLAICYWSGKAFEYDPFGAQQAFLTGARSENRLIEMFNKKSFGAIQIEIDMSQRTSYFLPQKAVTALLENYKTLDGQSGIFVPRGGYSEGGAVERSAN
jgi:phytoene dehydrogenase-like protein